MMLTHKAIVLWNVMSLSLTLKLASSSPVPCGDFNCQNGATCVPGPPDFDEHKLVDGSFLRFHKDGMEGRSEHCECPPRYTGIDCSIPYQECGEHKCYFGGQCFLGLEDVLGTNDLFCDCSLAYDLYGQQYSGKNCENLLTDTDAGIPLWSKAEPDDAQAYAECGLQCENGGRCKTGTPDPTNKMAFDVYRRSDSAQAFEWCDCPGEDNGGLSFLGSRCELPATKCGDQVCFNNAQCVERIDATGNSSYECGCRGPFDGKYCEFKATSKCPMDDDRGEQDYWCMNGSHCRYEASLGCLCPPGYHGLSCSFFAGTDSGDESLASDCNLDCNGHGTCTRDGKDISYLDVANGATNSDASGSENLEHCVCNDGFAGTTCDVQTMTHNEEAASRELLSVARFIFVLALIIVLVVTLALVSFKTKGIDCFKMKRATNSIRYQFVKSTRPPTVVPSSMVQWPKDCPNPGTNLSPSAFHDDEYTEPFKPSPSKTTEGTVHVPLPPSDDDVEADGNVILFMGPEMDEDGNELSNVSII
mmetsp:Transcript_10111/g.24465  ORF Transcript_10111/g.24465 Transcript_10111/m.24465 type:complete len:530 (+) Transcript_10111:60-1649(+)